MGRPPSVSALVLESPTRPPLPRISASGYPSKSSRQARYGLRGADGPLSPLLAMDYNSTSSATDSLCVSQDLMDNIRQALVAVDLDTLQTDSVQGAGLGLWSK